MQPHQQLQRRQTVEMVPTLIVIGVGVLFLLNNLNIIYVHDLWRYWPVILIGVGLAKMVDSPQSNGQVAGGVLFGVGALFLANTLGFLRLSWNEFWPLALIGAGVLMLWSRLAPLPFGTPDIPVGGHEGVLNEYAVFGGVERKLTTDDFRGGQVSAIFGGVEIDLRRANMLGDSAVIEVNAIFGGVEFKVPQNWTVVPSVAAILGGFSNRAVQPGEDAPGVKRLYIKGAAVFGGVDVKS